MDHGQILTAENAWTLGGLKYEWSRDGDPNLVSTEKSYKIPNTPNKTKVHYRCKISSKHCFRSWRHKEVTFSCQPNGK